jgi:hypothetical protein
VIVQGKEMSVDYAQEYDQLHEQHPKYFSGFTLKRYADDVAKLVNLCKPERLLDYGSGKGYQYLTKRLHMKWGGLLPHCYDVGVRQLSERPEGRFDGVICTDVLEHIAEPDLPIIIKDIMSFWEIDEPPSFFFASVSCRPSEKKELSDGRNVHLTIKPREWWEALFERTVNPVLRDGIVFKVMYDDEPHMRDML